MKNLKATYSFVNRARALRLLSRHIKALVNNFGPNFLVFFGLQPRDELEDFDM